MADYYSRNTQKSRKSIADAINQRNYSYCTKADKEKSAKLKKKWIDLDFGKRGQTDEN